MRAHLAERDDDAAEDAVLGQDEVEDHGLAIHRAVVIGRRRGRDDARDGRQRRRAAVEVVQLDPEDRLALDALLELVGRADGQDPAVVDDGDPLAQVVRLGHVVGREHDGAAGDGGLPGRDELADGPGGGDVQAERGLVEEQDPRVVEQAAREVHLLALAGRQGRDALEPLRAHPDGLDELVDALPALGPGEAVELAEHPELLAHGEDAVAGLLAAGDHVHDPADPLDVVDDIEAEDAGRCPRTAGAASSGS